MGALLSQCCPLPTGTKIGMEYKEPNLPTVPATNIPYFHMRGGARKFVCLVGFRLGNNYASARKTDAKVIP